MGTLASSLVDARTGDQQDEGNDNYDDAENQEELAQFSYLVDRLKAAIPGIFILTDIICGFPSESEADWAATMALVKKYRFPGIYSSRFFARRGTPASKMRQLNPRIIKARYQELVEFTQSLHDKNSEHAGKEVRVWFSSTEVAWNQTVGRTKD